MTAARCPGFQLWVTELERGRALNARKREEGRLGPVNQVEISQSFLLLLAGGAVVVAVGEELSGDCGDEGSTLVCTVRVFTRWICAFSSSPSR